MKNWAGNYEYSTSNILYPETVEALQDLVQRHSKIRVIGSRHSFNTIADSTECLISLERFAPTVNIDAERRTAQVSANVNYGVLSPILHRAGFALPNLASLPHISVAGAVSTGTHGSGVRNQNLAAVVSALQFVAADGTLVSLSRERDGETFQGAVVSLGALGVIVSLTLDLLPAYDMTQEVYQNLPLSQMEAHFDEIMSSAYSVSLFTYWGRDSINQVWLKRRVEDAGLTMQPDFFGAVPFARRIHPIAEISAESCTEQLGIRGIWYDRLPHFRIDATPSAGNELQTEYFVRRDRALDALRAVRQLAHHIDPLLLISEFRTIAADDLWLSTAYHRDSVGIHFTWKPEWPSVQKILPLIEEALAPYDARPHWGKLFTMPPARLQRLYEKLPDFRQLLQGYDPDGKFRNAFVEEHIFGD